MKRKYLKPTFEKSALVLQAATATGSLPRPATTLAPADQDCASLNGTSLTEQTVGGSQQDTAAR